MGRQFLSLVVQPGVDCKVAMPPCSALEIKNAALAVGKKPPAERSVLECDLATHSFVLCSLPPGGPMQAQLGTVVTNDPDAEAWLFLKARGPRAFHVLGRLVTDERRPKLKRQPDATSDMLFGGKKAKAASSPFAPAPESDDDDDDDEDDGGDDDDDDDDAAWPTASDVVARPTSGSGKQLVGGRAGAAASMDDEDDDYDDPSEPSEIIEVLLPAGDDVLEYPLSDAPSDDGSDDFVQWMTGRTQPASAKAAGGAAAAGPVSPTGGSRTQRRRAAQKRARDHELNGTAEEDDDEEDDEESEEEPAPRGGRGRDGGGGKGKGKGGGKAKGGKGKGGKTKRR